MLWVKRLLPLVIIAVAIYLYIGHARKEDKRRALLQDRHALVTAQIWVASAKYRAHPEVFISVRDSLLATCSLTRDDLRDFVYADSSKTEELTPFMNLVKEYVDSLLDIEDSLALARQDSLLKTADSTR